MAGWGEVTNANERKDLIAYMRQEDQGFDLCPKQLSLEFECGHRSNNALGSRGKNADFAAVSLADLNVA